ncbi:MAG: DUF1330 domain-containing protein [Xanthobacteraceae bacterium]
MGKGKASGFDSWADGFAVCKAVKALMKPTALVDRGAMSGVAPQRAVILAFDGIDQAKSWYNSPAQQEVNAMDDKAAKRRWRIVDSAM